MKKEIKILAIETSCDETAASVIGVENNQPVVLSNVVSSSANLHAKTGGIVPEVASRAQMEAMVPVVEEALQQASTKSEIRNPKQTKSNSNFSNFENSDFDIVSKLDIRASNLLSQITHVAVTNGPGLIGSLLVGFNAAKTIAYARKLPFIPINHIEGHIYSAFAESNPKSEIRMSKQKKSNSNVSNLKNSNLEFVSNFEFSASDFPLLALTVSGGHTSLTMMEDHGKYQTIGETIDDAAGEAFDKVAKLLGLGYPGGPVVSKLASEFRSVIPDQVGDPQIVDSRLRGNDNKVVKFPRPLIDKPNFDFSFSGLKTAVLTQTIKHSIKTKEQKQEICFAFEEAAVDVLCTKAIKAARKYRPKGITLAGGVAANQRLQEVLKNRIDKYNTEVEEKHRVNFYLPGKGMTGDNAAMIGIAAYYHIVKNNTPELFSTSVDSNATLG